MSHMLLNKKKKEKKIMQTLGFLLKIFESVYDVASTACFKNLSPLNKRRKTWREG